MKITATSPTRVDLAGGTIDLWPINQTLDHKATVNVGIACEATVEVTETGTDQFEFYSEDLQKGFKGSFHEACLNKELPLFGLTLQAFWNQPHKGLKVKSQAKSPAGAGLGGSSCLTVTMGAAIWRARDIANDHFALDEYKLVETAQNIEARLIHAPTGCQDYWGAIRGNVNVITFPFTGPHIETFSVDHVGQELNDRMIACYSGVSRASAMNNWEIFKKIFDGDQDLLSKFNQIGVLAERCGQALKEGRVGDAINDSEEEWMLRCQLWPGIETLETKALDRIAKDAGAQFTRVCGAGGGGVMAVLTPKGKKAEVCQALKLGGGTILDSGVSSRGLTISIEY